MTRHPSDRRLNLIMESVDNLPEVLLFNSESAAYAGCAEEESLTLRLQTPFDARRMRALLREHRSEVFRFACSIATDRDCAEDLTQRAFLALLERRQIWSSRSDVRAFLFHVVRKRVLKAARRRATHARLQEPARDVLYRAPPCPDDLIMEALEGEIGPEVREALNAALASLPPRRREALILARFHGLSHVEVARAMNLSPQTVANHVSMALRDLRDKLCPLELRLG